jgi:hypothetical protein
MGGGGVFYDGETLQEFLLRRNRVFALESIPHAAARRSSVGARVIPPLTHQFNLTERATRGMIKP